MASTITGTTVRRIVALVLVLAIGSGGLLLAASPTRAFDAPGGALDPAAGAVTISGGFADWGVKSSFRSYITGPIAQGSISTGAGATTNGDGSFHFPDASGQSDAGAIAASVGGSVRFSGHAGALDMTISDLVVELDGSASTLRADVVSKSLDTGEFTTYSDATFATLDLSGITPSETAGAFTWARIPATLSADGAAAFADFYPAGTALDPVTLTLAFGDDVPPTQPSTSTTTEASTTTTTEPPPTTGPITPSGERTATGPTGQSLTVTPADNLDPAGQTVTVSGSGYDEAIGIYLAFCVDKGATVAPSPCLGGVDMEGGSGASVWISSNPPPYGVGLAQPFGAGGTFNYTLDIQAIDKDDQDNVVADCLDGVTRCVIATRADHTQPTDRSADVKVPVYFAGQTIPDDPDGDTPWASVQQSVVRPGDVVNVSGGGFQAGEQVEVWLHSEPQWIATTTADPSGAVTYSFALPTGVPAGQHAVELRSLSGVSVWTSPFTVVAANNGTATSPTTGTLPVTGADVGRLSLVAAILVGAGIGLTAVTRRRARR